MIVDISARGARLEMQSTALLPQVFELRCASSGRSLRVYLVWQRGQLAGISFYTAAAWALDAGIDAWLIGER
jgi:hypothetical protein